MTDSSCPCGRKACDDPTPLCIVCAVFGKRLRHVDESPACGDCRVKLAALPGDIADAYPLLEELLEPRRGGQAGTSTRRDEAPIPLSVDPYDLIADHTTPQGPIRRSRLARNLADQIGHLPVAEKLGMWVREWAEVRDQGEARDINGWGVGELAIWLANRTTWAVDHHGGVDEYASELHELRGVLFALVGRTEPDERPQRMKGSPCPRCHHVTLFRTYDGDTQCHHPDCMSVWRPDDWERVSRATANAVRRGQLKEAV